MRLIDADAIPESATAISTDGRLFVAWSEIIKAPTINPENLRPHGRWAKDKDGDEYCERCFRYMPIREVTGDPSANNYCPNCGADMRGGNDGKNE